MFKSDKIMMSDQVFDAISIQSIYIEITSLSLTVFIVDRDGNAVTVSST